MPASYEASATLEHVECHASVPVLSVSVSAPQTSPVTRVAGPPHTITLGGRSVAYRIVLSRAARRLSVRVGPAGVEIIQPLRRRVSNPAPFLAEHAAWIVRQLDRVDRRR